MAALNHSVYSPKALKCGGLDVGLVVSNRNKVVPDKPKGTLKMKLHQPSGWNKGMGK